MLWFTIAWKATDWTFYIPLITVRRDEWGTGTLVLGVEKAYSAAEAAFLGARLWHV